MEKTKNTAGKTGDLAAAAVSTPDTFEAIYRNLLDQMNEGVAYCQMLYRDNKPVDFVYLNVNKAFTYLTGLKDVVGKKVSQIIPGIRKTNPELFEIYNKVATTGKSAQFETYLPLPLNFWLSIRVFSSRKGYFIAVFENITSRRKIEEEREFIARFPAENPNSIMRVDNQNHLIFANPASSPILKSWKCKLNDLVPESIQKEISLVITSHKPKEIRFDSDDHTYSFVLVPVPERNYVNFYGRDITDSRRAEKALAESEEKFRTLFESMSEMAALHEIVTGPSGKPVDYRILDVNPTYVRITGISRKKAIGALASELYGTGKPPYLEIYARVARTGAPTTFETFFRNMGKNFSISVFSPFPGKFVTVTRDITDFVNASKAVRDSEDQLNRIYNNVSDVLFVLAVEPGDNFRFFSVNKRFLEVTGVPEKAILGKPYQEVIPPPAHALVLANYKKAVRTRQTVRWEETSVYPTGIRHGDVYVTPVCDENGKCTQLIGMVHDVTERKRAEEAIKVSESRYRNLIDTQSDIIARSDPQGKLTFVNDAYSRMFGEPVEKMIGKSFAPTVIPEDLKISLDVLEKIKKPPYRSQTETRHITPQGIRWFSWENSAIVDENGKVTELQGVGRDITKRKITELEIQQRNDDLALLAAINEALNRGASLHSIIKLISAGFKKIFNGHGVSVYLPGEDKHKVTLQYLPISPETLGKLEKLTGVSIAHLEYDIQKTSPLQQAIESRKPYIINDSVGLQASLLSYADAVLHNEKSVAGIKKILPSIQKLVGLSSEMIVPMFAEEEFVGILEIGSRRKFTDEDLNRVVAIAGQLTSVIKRKQSDERLKKSEESFRNLFENSTIGLYRTTPQGNILLANPALVHLLGYESVAELVKRNLEKDGFEPNYARNEFRQKMEKEGSIHGLESSWKRKDGTFVFVRESAKVIHDSHGKIQYYEGTVEDITKLRESEKQIRRQVAIITSMLNSPQETTALLDKTGKVLVVNLNGAKNFGMKPEELIGKNIYSIIPEPVASQRRRIILEVMRTGIPAHFEDERSGMYFLNSVYPVNDPDSGDLLGATIFALNITDRKNAELRLRESERKLRRFNDAGLLGIIYWNMEGKILDANDKFLEMVGYSRNDLLAGKINWQAMTPPEYRSQDALSVKELTTKGVNSKPFEKEYIRKDGTRIPILLAGAMLDEERTHGVAFVMDISERKKTEIALQKSETFLRQTIDLVPHFIFSKDINSRFILANKAVADAYGTTTEKIIGKTDIDFSATAEEAKHFHEDDLAVIRRGVTRFIPEEAITDSRGNIRFLQTTKIPFEFGPENIKGILGVSVDITQQKKSETALRESEERFEAFMNHLPLTVFIKDTNNVNLFINRYMVDIMGAKEWTGKSTNELFPPQIAKGMLADDQHALEKGSTEVIELLQTARRGLRTFETTKFRIDRAGKPPLIGGFSIDATDRKKAEEELLRYTEELKLRNEDLERFNKVAVGREMRMIELKKQINELSILLGRNPPYPARSLDQRTSQTNETEENP